ncbi:DUF6777 domain-containing protein [Streptomyces sp. LZ34]
MSMHSWRLTSRRSVLIITLIVAVAVVAVYLIFYTSRKASAAEYRREPVGTTSVPAFTRPVGIDQRNVTSPSNGGRAFQGNTPGLYAGSTDRPPCDRQALISNLQADQAKAAAWSQVQGIRSTEIPAYVNQLSSVILRSDTYVTSYGYRGEVTYDGVVLQAGTAVFVDKRGAPVVKCNCGNPVRVTAPPQDTQPKFSGPTWPSFSQNTVTVVNSSPTVVNKVVVVEINKNVLFERGVGDINGDENAQDEVLPSDDYPDHVAMGGEQGVEDLPPPPDVTPSPADTETMSPPGSTPQPESTSPSETEPTSESTTPPGTEPTSESTAPSGTDSSPEPTSPPSTEQPPSEQPPSEQFPTDQPTSEEPPSEQPPSQQPPEQPQQPPSQQPPPEQPQPQQPQPQQPQPQQPQPQQPQQQPPAS